MITLESNFTVDKENKKIKVNREFRAPLDLVWKAWTDSQMLDQWWAPKPWKAQTKKMDFKNGGSWLYCMVGPEGEKHWSGNDYSKIEKEKSFESFDYFCDENGIKNNQFAGMKWNNNFNPSNQGTEVDITIYFDKLEDLEQIIKMGFTGGFAMGHRNLDELLNSIQN